MLDAMSPGTGHRDQVFGVSGIANLAGLSRQRAAVLVFEAKEAGLVELAIAYGGTAVYRKTKYGSAILSRWKAAGWTSKPVVLKRGKPA